MPTAPECLSMNISSMQTAKEHFHPWNTTVAGGCVPRKDIQARLAAVFNPVQRIFLLGAGEGRQ